MHETTGSIRARHCGFLEQARRATSGINDIDDIDDIDACCAAQNGADNREVLGRNWRAAAPASS